MPPSLLQVDDLHVTYPTQSGDVGAVRGVDLVLERGQVVGLIGESGSGKSTLCHAILGLLPAAARTTGRILLEDRNLLTMGLADLNRVRGRRVALVPQGAMSALNPTISVGAHLVESIRMHLGLRGSPARRRARELLEATGLTADVLTQYPHELSGGMRQRAVIATALAGDPDLIVADEPTTGLDVLVQTRVLRQLRHLQATRGLTLLLASHDLRLLLAICDRIAVMYAGRIVEIAPAETIARHPRHPYTAGLLASLPPPVDRAGIATWDSIPGKSPDPVDPPPGCPFHPRCPHLLDACTQEPPIPMTDVGPSRVACLLQIHGPVPEKLFATAPGTTGPNLSATSCDHDAHVETRKVTKAFVQRRGPLRRHVDTTALDGVDLIIHSGETVGLVGESGSGKTTLARVILGLTPPTGGDIQFRGRLLSQMNRRELQAARRKIALITQDPYDALHPSWPVSRLVAEPLDSAGTLRPTARRERIVQTLRAVGLETDDSLLDRRAAELSGGQQQRVALARALIAEPALIIADEPTSMLDASIRGSILNLLRELKHQGITMLLITHDLAEAAYLSDRIYLLQQGRVVDHGSTRKVLIRQPHPYATGLLAAIEDPLGAAGPPPSPRHPAVIDRAGGHR